MALVVNYDELLNGVRSIAGIAKSDGQKAIIGRTIHFIKNLPTEDIPLRTAEELREALNTLLLMDVSDQLKYFGCLDEIDTSADGVAYIVYKYKAADIINIVNKYNAEKKESRLRYLNGKLKGIIDEIGIDKVEQFIRDVKES